MWLFILLEKICPMEEPSYILVFFADGISLVLCNLFPYRLYLYTLVVQSGGLFSFGFSISARLGGCLIWSALCLWSEGSHVGI